MANRDSVSLRLAVAPLSKRIKGLSFGVLTDLSAVTLLLLSMWLIVRAGEAPPILHLTFAIVGVRALALGRASFRYVERLSSHDAALEQLEELRAEAYEALHPRVPAGITGLKTGDVLERLVADTEKLQDEHLRVRGPRQILIITLLLSLIIVFLLSKVAALIIFIGIVVAVLIGYAVVRHHVLFSATALADLKGQLRATILEIFEWNTELRVFGALDQKMAEVSATQIKVATIERRSAIFAGLAGAISIASGMLISLILIRVLFLTGSTDSAPIFASVVIAPIAIFELLSSLAQILENRALVRKSASRVDEMLFSSLPAEIPSDQKEMGVQEIPLQEIVFALDLKDVVAKYPGKNSHALKTSGFSLKPGEKIVIRGDSGSGKSTLADVLTKFLNYDGEIKVFGRELAELSISETRRIFGLCEQRPHIFDDSLAENLRVGREDASDQELWQVLERVNLKEWALSRGGLGMNPGEGGAQISGGEAQRIALARALLAEQKIIIFDEPVSEVDEASAAQLLHDIFELTQDRTVVLITHTELPEKFRNLRVLRLV